VLDRPIDGGQSWRGKRLFGDHKTWRGLIVAPLMGELIFALQYFLAILFPQTVSWSRFSLNELPWWFGFVLGAGAILGDLIKSFFKRRVNIAPGAVWFPFDQIDFLLGAAVLASLFVHFTGLDWVVMTICAVIAHMLVNRIGFWLKLKDTPW
jgi:CDP-2,3-bis-(O-geranylgeranyl)-sn-glycerol synthase